MPDVYIERIDNHPFRGSLQNCLDSISLLEELEDIEEDQVALNHIERLKFLFDLFKNKLDQIEPYIITAGILNNWNSNLQKVNTEINQFRSSRNISHLQSANTHAENIIPSVLNLSNIRVVEDENLIKESIISLKRSIGQYRRYIEDDVEEINNVRTNLEEKTNELTSLIDEKQSSLEELHTNKKEELDTLKTNCENQFDSVINTFNDSFGDEQSERENWMEEEKQRWKNEFKALKTSFESQANESLDELHNKFAEYENDLNNKQNKLTELFDLVTDGSISGAYHKAAKDEGQLRVIWYLLTSIGFAGLIGFSIFAFLIEGSSIDTWLELFRKILFTGAIGAFVSYSAKQASDHKEQERFNRNIELKMKSIDPYINIFDDTKKQEIKEDLVGPLFKENQISSTTESNNKENPQLPLDSILSLIDKISKK